MTKNMDFPYRFMQLQYRVCPVIESEIPRIYMKNSA